MPVNQSEQFVYEVCRKTFLSLWSYANPRCEDPRKELCDILIVCGPHVIIFSVKERRYRFSFDIMTSWLRWQRKTIRDSAKQIYGAERKMNSTTHVIRSDGTRGLTLPESDSRQVHRVAVALGGRGRVPMFSGDFGKGFVHVFDEVSFATILDELDTIMDFLDYLSAKEQLYESGSRLLVSGGEENLLAFYLHRGRNFPTGYTDLVIEDDLWAAIRGKEEFRKRKQEDKKSYVWDALIDRFCRDHLDDRLEFSDNPGESELAIRTLALEDRFARRLLGDAFTEFLELANANKISSRLTSSPSGTTYVFLAKPRSISREDRVAELSCRCLIARSQLRENQTVVGLSMQLSSSGQDREVELMYLHVPVWGDREERKTNEMKKELGYFVNPQIIERREDEYPNGEG